ncbi:hypothetical protein KQI77_08650 [Clostridium sp. MSJ-8]|uniref:hypothetical protein n=1 Tax=Clostridium sp. MSJ-8 TaxID=2841510 RepID=UPI001C0F2A84|nr:hypothetical protein [Clostridium sp. MSJ-8]MBU5488201.1 hypothetical protein [Clostridium sp. MSJ-8]
MLCYFKYSDTYYSYCSEYKKYKEALEYVEEKLRCIRSSLSGLDDAVNRFYRSEITARSVSGRPKTAYNYQHSKVTNKIRNEVATFNSMIAQLQKQRDVIERQMNRYMNMKNIEKARCEEEMRNEKRC